ncbi:HTTM domain-containing protein [Streptomyces sp. NPDC008150]|uniref:HTTM domain-containing protein n=1 Tax=Streptomyces sp. NPDC008150 TaxID=3364816 RepID=UPI0036E6A431
MNRFSLTLSRGIARITDSALGPYQTAVVRTGFATTWLLFLLREFPHRQELYGPDGPWSWSLARQLTSDNGAFTVLMWARGQGWFELVYGVAVVSSALLLVGWRTRTMSVLFMVGVLSLQNRSVFVGDGGDNVLHLMSIYLVFTRCGQVWSLDARRERRERAVRARGGRPADATGVLLWSVLGVLLVMVTAAGKLADGSELFVPALLWTVWLAHGLWWAAGRRERDGHARVLLDVVTDLMHNAAVLVIMAEACLIYATAGWYKIQGSRWQDGTAVYYPLHLDYFSPWPALADLLSSYGAAVMIITYGTVIVQVAFPFTLFNRRVKNVLLVVMMTEHAVIAVVLGLPFFSLAMIAADAVFLPTSFLQGVGRVAVRARARVLPGGGRPVPGPRAEPDGTAAGTATTGPPAAGARAGTPAVADAGAGTGADAGQRPGAGRPEVSGEAASRG